MTGHTTGGVVSLLGGATPPGGVRDDAVVIVRRNWLEHAACRDADVSTPESDPFFYPDGALEDTRREHDARAAAWCVKCPVTAECAGYAADADIREGWWGAQNQVDRMVGLGWTHKDGKFRRRSRRPVVVPEAADGVGDG